MTDTLSKVINNLKSVDWTFAEHSSKGHITSLHPYPARFIPIIPRTIIETISNGVQLNILDPFAGCGTSLIEGLNAGHNVFGIDVNALAILLQNVYSYSYNENDLKQYNNLFEQLINLLLDKKINDKLFVNIPNIDHWFSKDTQNILSTSIETINSFNTSTEIKNLAKFTLSRIIVKISNQQSDTQYRAVYKKFSYNDIVKNVEASYKAVLKYLLNTKTQWKGKSLIIQGDSRDKSTYLKINEIDLIITSPPYPNAYEYWLYHKYRMYWLNLDPLWSRTHEIGARPYYSGSGKLNAEDFQKDMEQVFIQLFNSSKKDAIQFWLIGDSIIKGKIVNNTDLITNACEKNGCNVIEIINRNRVRSRSSFQGIGRQKKEEILIIKKI